MTDIISKIMESDSDPVEILRRECDNGTLRAYLVKETPNASVFIFVNSQHQECTVIRFEYATKTKPDHMICKMASISAELFKLELDENPTTTYDPIDAVVFAEDSADLCKDLNNCISFSNIGPDKNGTAKTRYFATIFKAIMART